MIRIELGDIMLAMLIDDCRSSLSYLVGLLGFDTDIECRTFDDPTAALEAAATRRFDLFVVDNLMPKVDGITLTRQLRGMPHHGQVPIVMLTGTSSQSVRLQALEAGATDFLPKSAGRMEHSVKLRNMVALARALRQLSDQSAALAREVEAATQALQDSKREMILRLSLAIEYRDNDTGEHTLRVARYSQMIAEELGLSDGECRAIYMAAPLHDIGKVAVPDHILLKPGRLTDEEAAVIRSHAEVGERILGGSASDLIRLASDIAGYHHERWDGRGYPRRLAGAAIPLGARIVAVADAFDAMTTDRPYKSAMAPDAALAVIAAESGAHFDPRCANAFLASYERLHASGGMGRLAERSAGRRPSAHVAAA